MWSFVPRPVEKNEAIATIEKPEYKPKYVPVQVSYVQDTSVFYEDKTSKAVCLYNTIAKYDNVREEGYNDGPIIRMMQAYTGNKPPDPYCGSGVCFVLGECGIDNPRSGWSPTVSLKGSVKYIREDFGIYPEKIESPLVLGIFGNKGRINHTGFGLMIQGKMTRSGEFNTSGKKNDYGQRDGDGFHYLYRPNLTIYSLTEYK